MHPNAAARAEPNRNHNRNRNRLIQKPNVSVHKMVCRF
jgi:hypothetical protein